MAMVVQNDAETIERALRSFYRHVEAIVVTTDPARGWSGVPVEPDETLRIIRTVDTDKKTHILEGDFFRFADPLKNETYQRQRTVDILTSRVKGLDWICQIDADEEFLDFTAVLAVLEELPRRVRCLRWCLIPLFRKLADGRYLTVVDSHEAKPFLEGFYLGHRPGARMISARMPALLNLPLSRQTLRLNALLVGLNRWTRLIRDCRLEGVCTQRTAVLHYSYAKSEWRVKEKLRTFGHTAEFDHEGFLELWRKAETSWRDIRDFHPTLPGLWPALRPFALDDLRTGDSPRAEAVGYGEPPSGSSTRQSDLAK